MISKYLFPKNVKRSQAWFLITFFFFQFSFYGCMIFHITVFKYLKYIVDAYFAIYFLICALQCHFKSSCFLEKMVITMYFVIFIGLFVGILDGQYIAYALKGASTGYLLWGVYFYLKRNNVPEDYVMNIVKYFIIGTFFITLICYIQFPNCWFGLSNDDSAEGLRNGLEKRGTLRFDIPGKFLVSLLIFYLLQSFEFTKKKIIQLSICFIFLLLTGHRFPMAACMALCVLMILLSTAIKFKTKFQLLLIVTVICSLIFVIPATRNIIDKLTNLTEEGGADGIGEDNIRLRAATYYFYEFNNPNDYYHKIFGNGIYFPNSGEYSKKIDFLHECHFWEIDVEYCQFYIYFGLLGLLVLSLWYISSMFINVPKQYAYVKYFFSYIIIAMIAGGYWVGHLSIISMLSYFLVKKRRIKQLAKI